MLHSDQYGAAATQAFYERHGQASGAPRRPYAPRLSAITALTMAFLCGTRNPARHRRAGVLTVAHALTATDAATLILSDA